MQRSTSSNPIPRMMLIVGLLTLFSCAVATAEPLEIDITEPATGDSVGWRPTIKGTVSDPDAEIWVVIHPKGISGFWVQPPVTVDGDSWSVDAYVGRKGNLDLGNSYEIRAYANPQEELREGERDSWPPAEAMTKVVVVTRR